MLSLCCHSVQLRIRSVFVGSATASAIRLRVLLEHKWNSIRGLDACLLRRLPGRQNWMASTHRWGPWGWDMRYEIAVGPPRVTQLALQIAGTSKACHLDSHTTVASRLPPLKTHIVLAPHRAARVPSRPHLPLAFHIQVAHFYRPLLTRRLRYRRLHHECWNRTQALWKLTFVGIEVAAVPRTSRQQNQLSLRRPHPLGVHWFRLDRR